MKRYFSISRSLYKQFTIGIRKEDKGKWERRTPLTPETVSKLIDKNIKIILQPSPYRIYSQTAYEKTGAQFSNDLKECDLILGIKEVPKENLIADKKYLFFSHTHKGQSHNLPLLKEILNKRIHLMDYELLVDDKGQRMVAFGKHAGYAGMINCLHGLGQQCLTLGFNTPFLNIGRAHMYYELDDAKQHIEKAGKRIKAFGWTDLKDTKPLVFVFTGSGNVSNGAQEIFKVLPHEYLSLKELQKNYHDLDKYKVYGLKAELSDYIKSDSMKYSFSNYLKYGKEKFYSVFHKEILPYTSVLVNGAYWDAKYPKLILNQHLKELKDQKKLNLILVADISCDLNGPLEFVQHATKIDDPFYYFDVDKKKISDSGIQVMTVDNLPAELPLEASKHFSSCLEPLLLPLAEGSNNPTLEKATIAKDGKVVERFKYLNDLLVTSTGPKKILLLGSGRVAAPLVDYFLKKEKQYEMVIASNSQQEAEHLIRGRQKATYRPLDVGNTSSLQQLINGSDIVVSFVPASLHYPIAKECVELSKPLVTASYVSPEIQSLDQKAIDKNSIILMELGLDPGIDHLLAMQCIEEQKQNGNKIDLFISWCGGLPAPECSDNPLGYKFSWSPKGVLLASLNPAQFLRDGQLIKIEKGGILDVAEQADVYKGFQFEVLPNRDSLKYLSLYGLQKEDLKTMFRGTLRYKGFSNVMQWFRDASLLSLNEFNQKELTWQEYMKKLKLPAMTTEIKQALDWLELFSAKKMNGKTPMDALCSLLEEKLKYEPGERDMVCLYHQFEVTTPQQIKKRIKIRLVAYGDDQYTAMAKTVALPAALGTEMILEGRLKDIKGVVLPLTRDLYEPILQGLRQENIKWQITEEILK